MPHSRRYYQSLKESRNFLLESMPQALALAKRFKDKPKQRGMALRLYFQKRQRLAEIEKALLEGYE